MSASARTNPVTGRARLVAALALCVSLGGCGIYGDFGRVRPSLADDDIHAWMGPAAAPQPNGARSRPELTDEERQLRDLAYPLIQPPYDRQRWDRVLGEFGVGVEAFHYPDRGAYASHLLATAYRSQTARYNRLIEDIRSDVVRLDPFFEAAHYVLDMDAKREKALTYIGVTPQARAGAEQRIAENRNIVRWVRESLAERAASYKIALDRMVIAAPSPVAVEAERSLTLLKQRISGYAA